MGPTLIVAVVALALVAIVIAKTAVVVPQQNAFVVERLGKFAGTLEPGFHILLPFFDVIRYKHSLKGARWTWRSRSASRETTSRSASTGSST